MEQKTELGLEIFDLLEEFENKLESLAYVPFTGKVMMGRNEILEIIKDINISLPKEIQDAKWITQHQKEILEKAQMEADMILSSAREEERLLIENARISEQSIISDAQERAKQLVDSSTIVEQAHMQADKTISEAQMTAQQIMDNAYEHTERLLSRAANQIVDISNTINGNLNELREYRYNSEFNNGEQ